MIIETIILYIHLKMNFVHLIYIIRIIVRRCLSFHQLEEPKIM